MTEQESENIELPDHYKNKPDTGVLDVRLPEPCPICGEYALSLVIRVEKGEIEKFTDCHACGMEAIEFIDLDLESAKDEYESYLANKEDDDDD
jgi:hypothetical protein